MPHIANFAVGHETLPETAAEPRQPRGMMICDAHGGTLALDLSNSGLYWLVDACRSLLAGSAPPGACMLKVDAGSTVYLVNRRAGVDGAIDIQITDLYDTSQRVLLSHDLTQTVAALVERLIRAQPMRH